MPPIYGEEEEKYPRLRCPESPRSVKGGERGGGKYALEPMPEQTALYMADQTGSGLPDFSPFPVFFPTFSLPPRSGLPQ